MFLAVALRLVRSATAMGALIGHLSLPLRPTRVHGVGKPSDSRLHTHRQTMVGYYNGGAHHGFPPEVGEANGTTWMNLRTSSIQVRNPVSVVTSCPL
jgi:hypothetical protein